MNPKIKIIAFIAAAVISAPATRAQNLSLGINAGWQGLRYNIANGNSQLLPGASFEAGYRIALGSHWGIGTGLGIGLYRSKATVADGTTVKGSQVDDEGTAFIYQVAPTGYSETQHFGALAVPLTAVYETNLSGRTLRWQMGGGIKAVVPLGGRTTASAQSVAVSGYYPDVNVTITNLPSHGFGSTGAWQSKGLFALQPGIALTAATGLIFKPSPANRAAFYCGLFFDYGLNDMQAGGVLPLLTYNSSGVNDLRANSVLSTREAMRLKLFAVGVQLKMFLPVKK